MPLELAICCGMVTKQVGKSNWTYASNTQSVYSVCQKCQLKYFNWFQPDPAGNSGGSELVIESEDGDDTKNKSNS